MPVTPELSAAVAVTVTVPIPVPDSKPEELIVAEPVPGVTDQVTAWLVALAGSTVALICKVPLFGTLITELAPVTVMLDTRVGAT